MNGHWVANKNIKVEYDVFNMVINLFIYIIYKYHPRISSIQFIYQYTEHEFTIRIVVYFLLLVILAWGKRYRTRPAK